MRNYTVFFSMWDYQKMKNNYTIFYFAGRAKRRRDEWNEQFNHFVYFNCYLFTWAKISTTTKWRVTTTTTATDIFMSTKCAMCSLNVSPLLSIEIRVANKCPERMAKWRHALEFHRRESFWPQLPLENQPSMPSPSVHLRSLNFHKRQNWFLFLRASDLANGWSIHGVEWPNRVHFPLRMNEKR